MHFCLKFTSTVMGALLVSYSKVMFYCPGVIVFLCLCIFVFVSVLAFLYFLLSLYFCV